MAGAARRRDGAAGKGPVVESSTLRRVSYSGAARVLTLTFTSGRIYAYYDVPPRIHAGLMRADSKGRYFNRHIRPRFAYRCLR
ncbi:MAG TPA: KTSC domain-containing protein [Ferrovibrio sp.]|jgi:hypothetical protein|uniref:KTSC domain-containing protein n=1 Tax=Ferrovibrio sp. TaxID=1917215 RepID=UPI002B4AAF8A|nr:KTSC domain-containing protein [Ferrovibrio sp.]HLT76391.1 KTSC domain-containing protein [Ferrovibrio sp.]